MMGKYQLYQLYAIWGVASRVGLVHLCKSWNARACVLRGTTCSLDDTASDTEETERERGFEEVERGKRRRWIGRWGRSKQSRIVYLVYREKTTTATRAYESVKPRVGELRTEPFVDSKVRRQSSRFSCLRTPELFGRVLQRQIFILRRVLANTRDLSLIDTRTHRSARKRIRLAQDRIDLKILHVARTTAVNVEVPIYRYVDRTTRRGNQPPVSLFTETKGSARSSLIRTIDLLRREYHSKKSMELHAERVVFQPRRTLRVVHHCALHVRSLLTSHFNRIRDNATSFLESKDGDRNITMENENMNG